MASEFRKLAQVAEEITQYAAKSKDPRRLAGTAQELHVLADEVIANLTASPSAPRLACKKGCAACCHRLVIADLPEIIAIAGHVTENFSPEQKQEFLARNDKIQLQNSSYWHREAGRAVAPCPFLVDDACSIYESRPLSCRACHSDDPRKCEPNISEGFLSVIPEIAESERVMSAVVMALRDVGLPSGGFELGPAVAAVLTDPNILTQASPLDSPLNKFKLASEFIFPHRNESAILRQPASQPGVIQAAMETQTGDVRKGIEMLKRQPCREIEAIFSHALPYQSDTEEEISEWLSHWDQSTEKLHDSGLNSALLFECLSKFNTYRLAYTGRDVRPHLESFMNALQTHATSAYPHLVTPLGKRKTGKFRLGYVSYKIKDFNGSKWAFGWLQNHSKEIETYVINLAEEEDRTSSIFRRQADHYYHLPFPVTQIATFIRNLDLDALIFTDVGMDGYSIQMSLLRLARIHLTAWGHPVTSGAPNMDYYLSSELMEPPNGDKHYSEKLIRLPGTGLTLPMRPVTPSEKSAEDLGLPSGGYLFVGQNPIKAVPKDDPLFFEIAARSKLPVVFLAGQKEGFSQSLARRLAKAGSNVRLVGGLPPNDYLRALQLAEASLDTPTWNGGNTTVQALQLGTPVATMPGEFMRGRHSLAFLAQAGAPGLVAQSAEDYTDLVLNKERRVEAMRNLDPQALLGDVRPVRAIDELLLASMR